MCFIVLQQQDCGSITPQKLLGQEVAACCSVDRIIMIVLVKVMLDKC